MVAAETTSHNTDTGMENFMNWMQQGTGKNVDEEVRRIEDSENSGEEFEEDDEDDDDSGEDDELEEGN